MPKNTIRDYDPVATSPANRMDEAVRSGQISRRTGESFKAVRGGLF